MNKIIVIVLCLLFVSGNASGQARNVPDNSLDERVKNAISDFKGKVWIYAKNLETGKDYGLRADEYVRTASTIKLPIMAEAFRQVSVGRVAWTDQFELTKQNRVGGSGILNEFSEGTKIDFRTAVNLMIVVSDNSATNLVLDRITADAVNEFMGQLGLKDTLSMRKVLGGGDAKVTADPVNPLFGIGRSSPRDMVKLLEMLERGQVVSKEASAEMIAILKRQQYKDGIGRNVLDTVPVASKSGSLDRLRSDVGIVYTRRGRIAMAITVDDMPIVHYNTDDVGSLLIWRISEVLQEGLAR